MSCILFLYLTVITFLPPLLYFFSICFIVVDTTPSLSAHVHVHLSNLTLNFLLNS